VLATNDAQKRFAKFLTVARVDGLVINVGKS